MNSSACWRRGSARRGKRAFEERGVAVDLLPAPHVDPRLGQAGREFERVIEASGGVEVARVRAVGDLEEDVRERRRARARGDGVEVAVLAGGDAPDPDALAANHEGEFSTMKGKSQIPTSHTKAPQAHRRAGRAGVGVYLPHRQRVMLTGYERPTFR